MNNQFYHELTTLINVEISKLLIKEEEYLKKRLNSYLGNERPPDEGDINKRIEAYKYRLEKDKLFEIIRSICGFLLSKNSLISLKSSHLAVLYTSVVKSTITNTIDVT